VINDNNEIMILDAVERYIRGEMNPDLMYGCGGDRPFLRQHHLTLPQFLQLVRDKGDDDRAIVDAVKHAATTR